MNAQLGGKHLLHLMLVRLISTLAKWLCLVSSLEMVRLHNHLKTHKKGLLISDLSNLTLKNSEWFLLPLCTGYPLVDACMRELSITGYASNHARLNAASFLAYTMSFDWRLAPAKRNDLLVCVCVKMTEGILMWLNRKRWIANYCTDSWFMMYDVHVYICICMFCVACAYEFTFQHKCFFFKIDSAMHLPWIYFMKPFILKWCWTIQN